MTPILDLAGVYCPMGCGQTLHRMPGGMISCLAQKCPDKGAAQKILGDRETEHVVELGEDGFTIKHPLHERLDDVLMTCELHQHIAGLDEDEREYLARPSPGRYRATWTGERWLLDAIAQEG